MPAHFLFTTFGSLGDVHPYIAVGIGLRERGHKVTIATSALYRAKIESERLGFHPVRPDLEALLADGDVIRRAFHPRTGSEYIMRSIFLPHIEESADDLMRIAPEADVMVGHVVSFATPTVAERLKKKWISIALQPSVFLSAYDPPVISGMPLGRELRALGPGFWKLWLRYARWVTRRWGEPLNRLRRKLGLRPLVNPLLRDMFSPWGTQAWFSSLLANPQRDWPPRTTITGFAFYDKPQPDRAPDNKLPSFLDAGPAPVVFTLGSSAVFTAEQFYEESAEAAARAGCRAVLLIGGDPRNQPARHLPDSIMAAEYASYSELFPRAAAIVHQGGIGTTAQALRAARPMLVVPFSHDQPDNAARVEHLGIARVIPRRKYRASRVAKELRLLLERDSYRERAIAGARVIASEDGVRRACEGLERMLLVRTTEIA